MIDPRTTPMGEDNPWTIKGDDKCFYGLNGTNTTDIAEAMWESGVRVATPDMIHLCENKPAQIDKDSIADHLNEEYGAWNEEWNVTDHEHFDEAFAPVVAAIRAFNEASIKHCMGAYWIMDPPVHPAPEMLAELNDELARFAAEESQPPTEESGK